MTHTLSVVNLKGGVGKTAIAVNFSAYCGMNGHKTLLVDLDPQTNATFSCIDVEAWQEHARTHGTVGNLLGSRAHTSAQNTPIDAYQVIKKDVFLKVDLIPSHLDLFTIDLDLATATGRELRLRRALQPLLSEYDMIVFDCPPNLTIPTQNAMAASSNFIVPVSPDYLSGIGVGILLGRVRQFCTDLDNHKLKLAGIVISRVGRPAEHRARTEQSLRDEFGQDVLTSEIRERTAVAEAASKQRSIFDMGNRDAAAEFKAVSAEILARLGG